MLRVEVGHGVHEGEELVPPAFVAPGLPDVLDGPEPVHVGRERPVPQEEERQRTGAGDGVDVVRALLLDVEPAGGERGRRGQGDEGEEPDREHADGV